MEWEFEYFMFLAAVNLILILLAFPISKIGASHYVSDKYSNFAFKYPFRAFLIWFFLIVGAIRVFYDTLCVLGDFSLENKLPFFYFICISSTVGLFMVTYLREKNYVNKVDNKSLNSDAQKTRAR